MTCRSTLGPIWVVVVLSFILMEIPYQGNELVVVAVRLQMALGVEVAGHACLVGRHGGQGSFQDYRAVWKWSCFSRLR